MWGQSLPGTDSAPLLLSPALVFCHASLSLTAFHAAAWGALANISIHPKPTAPHLGQMGFQDKTPFSVFQRECRRRSPMYPATPTLWIKFGILALPRPPLPLRTVYTDGRPPPVIHPTYTPRAGRSLSQLKGGPEPAQQQACESRGPPTVGTELAE